MLWYNRRILNDKQIQELKKHQYSCVNKSILDPIFQIWWNYAVTLVPMWVAPNLITIIGLVLNLIATLILIYLCPSAKEDVSGLIPLMVAMTIFIYQTLDAIDGKQARRTGSSNALGELFDHGCDSLTNLVFSTALACALSMGYLNPFLMLGFCYLTLIYFYLAQWQTYVTGQMRFGYFDVTELNVGLMVMMVFTSIMGSNYWGTRVLNYLTLRDCFLIFTGLAATLSLPPIIHAILFEGKGKNRTTVAETNPITPMIPLLLVLGPSAFLAFDSTDKILETYTLRFIMVFGLVCSKITNKLIVAQMTKSDLPIFDRVFIFPILMYVNQSILPLISEQLFLSLMFLFVAIDYVSYCQRICQDICESTGWKVFRIDSKPPTSAHFFVTSFASHIAPKSFLCM